MPVGTGRYDVWVSLGASACIRAPRDELQRHNGDDDDNHDGTNTNANTFVDTALAAH